VLAAKLERQAAGAGLGWQATGGAGAIARLGADAALADDEEFGEGFFELARLAADRGIDAEEALRRAAMRFRSRVAAAERLAACDGTTLPQATAAQRRAYWEAAGAV
jgi:uncharacterized protein YabN with tetrapyrrole methylase and pyrophosphatase domain